MAEISNYLEDDWDDNNLTGRSSPSTGEFKEQTAGGTGDMLKGIYRPEWTVQGGSPAASSGVLVLDDSESVSTVSKFTTGRWSFWFQVQSSPQGGHRVVIMSPVIATSIGDDCYRLGWRYNGDYKLTLRNGGSGTTLITGSWPADTAGYSAEATRDTEGNFEIFLGGTSKGTATDTTHTSSKTLLLENGEGVTTHYDDLQMS